MDDTKNTKRKNHNGFEPWGTKERNAEQFFNGNYVKVISIVPMGKGKNDQGKMVKFYRFMYVLNHANAKIEDKKKQSSLHLDAVTLVVDGLRSKCDVFRVRREFEVQASKIVNKTRAKQPEFCKLFKKIDLAKVRWSHWYPSLRNDELVDYQDGVEIQLEIN